MQTSLVGNKGKYGVSQSFKTSHIANNFMDEQEKINNSIIGQDGYKLGTYITSAETKRVLSAIEDDKQVSETLENDDYSNGEMVIQGRTWVKYANGDSEVLNDAAEMMDYTISKEKHNQVPNPEFKSPWLSHLKPQYEYSGQVTYLNHEILKSADVVVAKPGTIESKKQKKLAAQIKEKYASGFGKIE